MPMNIAEMLPLLRCPKTGEDLLLEGNRLFSTSGKEYPIINGVPILVRQIQEHHITPPPSQHISKNTATYSAPDRISPSGICLHLGSGAVPSTDKRVISLDVLPTDTVDIVAEAEALPFKDNCLDYVESGAVFEHVTFPLQSIKEVRRVLKEGGEMFIDTAFLQGYHGYPSHYFNMTPQAVEAHLCDGFILEDSYVPPGATVTHALVTQFDRFLELIPAADQNALRSMTMADALDVLRNDAARPDGLNSIISEYGKRSLAASFAIRATKPLGYEPGEDNDPAQIDRQTYYAARVGVIQRHHEVQLYRRFAAEKYPDKEMPVWTELPSLSDILSTCKVTDPSAERAYQRATDLLRQWDRNLTTIRTEAVAVYVATRPNLRPKPKPVVELPEAEPEAAELPMVSEPAESSPRRWFQFRNR